MEVINPPVVSNSRGICSVPEIFSIENFNIVPRNDLKLFSTKFL